MASQKAVKLIPIVSFERHESLTDLSEGDIIEINGHQERIYRITGSEIIAIYRGREEEYPDRKFIVDHRYYANAEMLKRGELHQNAWLSAVEHREEELQHYREYDNFLRRFEGLPEIFIPERQVPKNRFKLWGRRAG